MAIKLDNKVALITGSSSGIGAATATLFSSLGAKVVITGRNQENCDKVAQECLELSPHGHEALVVTADLNEEADVKKLFDQTIENFSRLDILVNNAGFCNKKLFKDEDYLDDFDVTMRGNLRQIVQLTYLARPYLEEARGCIVMVSSSLAIRPLAPMWSYCMAKAAIDSFTKILVQEFGPDIRVNCVNPGGVKTNFLGGMSEEILGNLQEGLASLKTRYGESGEIANVIAFLASDGATFMNGSTVLVDGGCLAY